MARRDDEGQPQDAELGASVQLENSETLEGPAGYGDGLDAGYIPADWPYGLDEDGVTAKGMREGDSLNDRLRREQPEEWTAEPDRSGRITMAGTALETRDAMAGTDVGIDGGAASAEESAMHDVDAGMEPVDDESPAEDPEVSTSLAGDPNADQAAEDAAADIREAAVTSER
ncbi:MAG: DUF5709 domain-containing protein [Pseudonocardia sp.]